MCQNSAIKSRKLHAVNAILDELNLKKVPLLRSFIGLWTTHRSSIHLPHTSFKRVRIQLHFEGGYFRCLRVFCGLKCVLVTRDVCKRPRHLHHWNRHSISDPVIPHIAVYNAYGFVTKWINASTVFVHVSDCMIGTGQTANTSSRKSTGDFLRYMQCKHKINHKNAKKTFFLFI